MNVIEVISATKKIVGCFFICSTWFYMSCLKCGFVVCAEGTVEATCGRLLLLVQKGKRFINSGKIYSVAC